jgi:hypothetical protein
VNAVPKPTENSQGGGPRVSPWLAASVRDRRDVRVDQKDLRKDVKDARADRRDLEKDRKDAGKDQQQK